MNTQKFIQYSACTLASIMASTLIGGKALAQRGEIESQTYEIVKEKNIEFPPANRLFDKVQPIQAKEGEKKVTYQFVDPQINLASPKLTPVAIASADQNTRQELPDALNNFIKIGAGNYGRFLAEGFVSTRATEDLFFMANVKQLSAATGPVDGANSANSTTDIKLGGKYIRSAYKIDGQMDYSRNNYFFYGYKPQPDDVVINRDSIRQTLNRFGVQLGFENTEPNSLVDYAVNTQFYTLSDRYNASEIDWGTTLKVALPVMDQVYALLDGGAFVSQRVDALTYNRNLFRVKPAFKYASEFLSVTAGVNLVNETDNTLDINRTRAFPSVNIDVMPFTGVHIFAGWDGDIVRNTLRSLLEENLWLAPNVLVANTEKSADIYAGIKGENSNGFSFEGRASYARYKNFYVFNNSLADTSKFSVLYDGLRTNVITVSAQVGYTITDLYRTSLKANFYNYDTERLEAAWHRPTFTLNWFNALTISKKLFLTSDFYTVGGIQAKNFQTGIITKLPVILDLNFKIDYLLTRNFSAFVTVNNVLGKQYTRYQYYPRQGLNFVGGLSFSF
jgi:hypothetical protein